MTLNHSILDNYKNRKILIAALNWGLGHASRILPIIHQLTSHNKLIIASDGLALRWLQHELPHIEVIELPSYGMKYAHGPMWYNLLKATPSILSAIREERKLTELIVKKYNIDMIISDHRLGVRAAGMENIFMAHQIRIPHHSFIASRVISSLQIGYINRFSACWIPDGAERMSGDLSDVPLSIPKHYIGPLSRFQKCLPPQSHLYDIVVILSGPEPARGRLEKKILSVLSAIKEEPKVVFVRGTDCVEGLHKMGEHMVIHNLADTELLQKIICQSKVVISRCGYSTLMDLNVLGKPAILIPTPGQPEQEYLARQHSGTSQFIFISEDQINTSSLKIALQSLGAASK